MMKNHNLPWKSYQKSIEIYLYIYNLFMFKTFSDNELLFPNY